MTFWSWLRMVFARLLDRIDARVHPIRHEIPSDHPAYGAKVIVTKTCGLCMGNRELGPDPCPMCNATGAIRHPMDWYRKAGK